MAARMNTCIDCVCCVCSGIRVTIDNIFRVLDIYGWILDSYIVDFFQDDLWQKLPGSWRNCLDEISPEELGKWILRETNSHRVWPLSLLALRKFVETAEICRNKKNPTSFRCRSNVCHDEINECKSDEKTTIDDHKFNNLFIKHVKKKKRYEIDVITEIVYEIAKKADCQCVVDIGAGMGHLARFLTFKYNLRVTCVEQNQSLIEGARKWDEQLIASLGKHITDFRPRKPEYVSLQVGVTEADRQQLADQLTAGEKFGLVGLHPCGDLAATLLRFYAAEDKARFICIVGCCYMKLSLENCFEKGYPMSQFFLGKGQSSKLTYTALEVACHAVEKHCDKLKSNNYNDLIVHAYRAVLECLLIEKNPNLRRSQLNNTKIKEDTTFEDYCKHATKCLASTDRPTSLDYERSDIKNLLLLWKRVLSFGSLRLMIAPLIETLVLFDRFLFLTELNLSASLKAEFDSRISPRNILLVSSKSKTNQAL